MDQLYPDINDDDFYNKIYNKLEFIINKTDEDKDNSINIDFNKRLKLQKHQLFVQNFMSVHTPYNKLLLIHATGTGKTLSAWSVSRTFIKEYRKIAIDDETPRVFIIGFTEKLFKTEFLKWYDLGFMNTNDTETLDYLSNKHGVNSQEYQKEYNTILLRFNNRKYDGYFTFYGYKEFFNKLFINKKNINLDNDIKSYNDILKHIDNGDIDVNDDILIKFKNSLLICDEIHNLYNSDNVNNYGIAIMFVTQHIKNMKSIYLTATPLNNNAREIIDLINLLKTDDKYLTNENYDNIDNIDSIDKLIYDNFKGKVSLFENTSIKDYPRHFFKGETIKDIKLFKFTRCYMNDFFTKNYKIVLENDIFNKDTLKDKIFNDIILPDQLTDDKLILNQTDAWCAKYNLFYNDSTKKPYGDLFNIDNLKKYSPKYHEMLKLINTVTGKIFIYHNLIVKSGINMISAILSENGFIEYGDLPNSNTKCAICKCTYNKHKKANHGFKPLKYIIYIGETSFTEKRNILNLFNAVSNIDGHEIKIFIGSKVSSEGITLKEVNECYIMAMPTNISKLIQIMGRCIRNGTHSNFIDENRKYVNIRLFVNSSNDFNTVEEKSYKKKILDHIEIQHIEKQIKEIAVDGLMYLSPEFKIKRTAKSILDYDYTALENEKITIKNKIDSFTFIHHNYIDNVIEFMIDFIKYIIVTYKVINIDNIIEIFKDNNFDIEYNTKLINKNYIISVVNKIIYYSTIEKTYTNSVYKVPNKNIIMVDDYIVCVNDINSIYDDVFNDTSKDDNIINVLKYIDGVDNEIIDLFKVMETKIKTIESFFELFNSNIPSYLLNNELNKSKNPLIKSIFKSIDSDKTSTNDVVGFIDYTQKFKIKNSIYSKGIHFKSLKKSDIIKYLLTVINVDEDYIYNNKIEKLQVLCFINLVNLQLKNIYKKYIYIKLI